jgi:hypothetical protein
VANTLKFSRTGAVGFIDWLDVFFRLVPVGHSNDPKDNDKAQNNEHVAGRKEAAEVDESNNPAFVAMDVQVPVCDERITSQ